MGVWLVGGGLLVVVVAGGWWLVAGGWWLVEVAGGGGNAGGRGRWVHPTVSDQPSSKSSSQGSFTHSLTDSLTHTSRHKTRSLGSLSTLGYSGYFGRQVCAGVGTGVHDSAAAANALPNNFVHHAFAREFEPVFLAVFKKLLVALPAGVTSGIGQKVRRPLPLLLRQHERGESR